MKKGDIVLLPFPFTDLSGEKVRPATVLVSLEEDVTVAFLSTKTNWQTDLDLLLPPSNQTGLKRESLLRTGKLATKSKRLVLGKLGELSSADLDQLDQLLIRLFQLSGNRSN